MPFRNLVNGERKKTEENTPVLYNEANSEKMQLWKTSSEKDEMFYDSPMKTERCYYVTIGL